MKIDINELRAILAYDPLTGVLTWKVAPPRKPFLLGKPAGATDPDGYILLKIKQVMYRANRLIWFYVTGEWPPADLEVEHWDGNPSNNRWLNLRLATRKQNQQNVFKVRSDSKTGIKGVSQESANSFSATVRVDGKKVRLGSFPTAELAGEAYALAKPILHPFSARP